MSTEYSSQQPNAPVTDSSGQPVDVVERDLDPANPTRSVDEVITPTSIKRKEQDAETLERKNAEVERDLVKR
jgi:hypothetical protein